MNVALKSLFPFLAAASIFLFEPAAAHAGLFGKIAKLMTAPVKVVLQGKVQDLPKLAIEPAMPLIDGAAKAIGGSVGQTMHNAVLAGPTATMNLANVQFIQAVAGIKAMKAAGVIKSNADCQALSSKIASIAELNMAGLGSPAQEVGNAACDTATPAEAASAPSGVSPPSPTAAAALGTTTGFAGLPYQQRVIGTCFVGGPAPFVSPGQFYIMSDLIALSWRPPFGWTPVAQLYLDGTGAYVIRLPIPPYPAYQLGLAANGQLFFINAENGALAYPASVGICNA